jgi:hypothetical protein
MNQSFLSQSFPAAILFAASAVAVSYPASAARIRHPVAVFTGLDKITGRTIAFEAAAGETVQFGTLQITERACFTHPATEAPQTTTFVEVDEVSADNQYKRIFSGWMFAASPGLHGIEHPIYDIWLTNCDGEGKLEGGSEASAVPAPAEAAQTPEASQAPEQKKSRHSRHNSEPSDKPAPPPGAEETGEPPQEQAGSEPPPLGQPIEVGPPPGFIPVPQAGRHAPVQRYYPADPGVEPETSSGEGY